MPSVPCEKTTGKILIVEDEAAVCLLMEGMLESLGYEVGGPAFSLEHGLRIAGSEEFSAALLDVNLAGEASYPIAAMLQARGVPFAFVTGYGTAAASEFPGVVVLQKPCTRAQLASIVEQLLPLGDHVEAASKH